MRDDPVLEIAMTDMFLNIKEEDKERIVNNLMDEVTEKAAEESGVS